jgi:hypothetical protein
LAASLASFRDTVEKLIRRFDSDRIHYLSKNYSEVQARVDFVTPFFKALGWDVENWRQSEIPIDKENTHTSSACFGRKAREALLVSCCPICLV